MSADIRSRPTHIAASVNVTTHQPPPYTAGSDRDRPVIHLNDTHCVHHSQEVLDPTS